MYHEWPRAIAYKIYPIEGYGEEKIGIFISFLDNIYMSEYHTKDVDAIDWFLNSLFLLDIAEPHP